VDRQQRPGPLSRHAHANTGYPSTHGAPHAPHPACDESPPCCPHGPSTPSAFPPHLFSFLLPALAAPCPRQVLREHHRLPGKTTRCLLPARCRQGRGHQSEKASPTQGAARQGLELGGATVARDMSPARRHTGGTGPGTVGAP